MNQTTSNYVWRLFKFFVLLPVGCFLTIAFFFADPNFNTALDNARPVLDRITGALEQYHRVHGAYPQELTELVNDGLLSEIPKLPSVPEVASTMEPYYQANRPLDFYQLSYGYSFKGGDSDMHERVFVSDDPRGWTKGHSSIMQYLVADRLAAAYQKQRDATSLERFMNEFVRKTQCNYLDRDALIRWLGPGTEIDVPPNASGRDKKGYLYQTPDAATKSYCLVYKDHWLKQLRDSLPAHERAKYPISNKNRHDPFVDYNYPSVDQLFLIEESNGQRIWTSLLKCSPSQFDKPPISAD
jgi:hypothetical protein